MTHAIDPTVVERAAEAVSDDLVNRALVIASCREPVGAGDGNTYVMSAPTLETMRRAIEFVFRAALASAIPEAVEQERELIKRAYLGVSVLRTMLQKEGMRLGVQAADDLMADMASLMPELPGTLALRARTTEQKGDRP